MEAVLTLVNVEQRDIEQGVRGSENQDPIALAMTRMGFQGVRVEADSLSWVEGRIRRVRPLPPTAREFIDDFDFNGRGEPFSFPLEA